jgi:uncharacterized phage-associated protein
MRFDERKTTQLAAYFLLKSNGELYLIKLLKLLYIADREAFRRLGRPISFDNYVSMDNGPVLSQAYNLMTGSSMHFGNYWRSMISDRSGHKLSITDESEVSNEDLSDAEIEIADYVFENFGHIPRFDLCDLTHSFPEWQDPQGSSLQIRYEDILKALEYNDDEIKHAIERIDFKNQADKFFEVA